MPGRPVSWSWFHSPDLSLQVAGRRIGEDFAALLFEMGEAMATRGRSLWAGPMREDDRAYRSALCRLRKEGVVVAYRGRAKGHSVHVSDSYEPEDILRPERLWRQRWGGIWSVLIYDIPESDRGMRDHLRRYLKRLRMGCLQKSVWVSPRDIRPEYDDWVQSVRVDFQSFLFEARTVLGRASDDIVLRAWDWRGISERHRWFLDQTAAVMERLAGASPTADEIVTLAREELCAYRFAMDGDPLLPSSLWPDGYAGRKVLRLHQAWTRTVRSRLIGGTRVA